MLNLYRTAGSAGKLWLRLMYSDRPVPASSILGFRKRLRGSDPLFPDPARVSSDGRALQNGFLRSKLADKTLGLWSLSAPVLNFLEQEIRSRRPKLILEFGSGVSTVCLARYMLDLHRADDIGVISLEQDAPAAAETQRLLEDLGLASHASVIHAPLELRKFGKVEHSFYNISAETLRSRMKDRRADFMVIDGPAAEEGARYGALPLLRSLVARQTAFYLDDALRDGELRIAELWAAEPGVEIDGIYLISKGLLAGRIHGCES